MSPTCPTCRRAFGPSETECRRCGTDVASLNQLLSQAADAHDAGTRLVATKPQAAAALLAAADAILPSPEVRRALACAQLLQGNFSAALALHRQCRD